MSLNPEIHSPSRCSHCGGYHRGFLSACPRIYSVQYFPSGAPKRIEYYPDGGTLPEHPKNKHQTVTSGSEG